MPEIRRLAYHGFTCEIRSDEIWFAVYDAFDKPCGTIERPHRGVAHWCTHALNGQAVTQCAVGPQNALRCLAIYHGA